MSSLTSKRKVALATMRKLADEQGRLRHGQLTELASAIGINRNTLYCWANKEGFFTNDNGRRQKIVQMLNEVSDGKSYPRGTIKYIAYTLGIHKNSVLHVSGQMGLRMKRND